MQGIQQGRIYHMPYFRSYSRAAYLSYPIPGHTAGLHILHAARTSSFSSSCGPCQQQLRENGSTIPAGQHPFMPLYKGRVLASVVHQYNVPSTLLDWGCSRGIKQVPDTQRRIGDAAARGWVMCCSACRAGRYGERVELAYGDWEV